MAAKINANTDNTNTDNAKLYIQKAAEALEKLENGNVNKINSYIRTLLGLKSILSSVPWFEGSRTVVLNGGHMPFGLTSYFVKEPAVLNLLTILICSSELDEDLAILNKHLDKSYTIKIEKLIPSGWRLVRKSGFVKKGEVIARGPEPFDELKANITGELKIMPGRIKITATHNISTGTKIQNLYLQKHVIKEECNRYEFVDTTEHPVTDETIENLKAIKLKPEIVNLKPIVQAPTLAISATSVLKRRSAGTFAQLWLGYNLAFRRESQNVKENAKEKEKLHNEYQWDKTVYVTKVYDKKHAKYQDCIVGIIPWLVAINSGGYEYNVGSDKIDVIGRHDGVPIDPFGYYVLKYRYPEIAKACLDYQLNIRQEKIRELKNALAKKQK